MGLSALFNKSLDSLRDAKKFAATKTLPLAIDLIERSAQKAGFAIGYANVKTKEFAHDFTNNTLPETKNFVTTHKRALTAGVSAIALLSTLTATAVNYLGDDNKVDMAATNNTKEGTPQTSLPAEDIEISEKALNDFNNFYKEKFESKTYRYMGPSRGYSPHVAGNIDALFNHPQLLKTGLEEFQRLSVDEAFNLAVLQESGGKQFDANGRVMRSSAGAIGIAQVIPATARYIAPSCTGAPLNVRRYYNDASYNEKLGRCYFREQHNNFGGDNVLAALAYNAGPGALENRIDSIGDPSKGEISAFDFLRKTRNQENRQYVLHIMARGGIIDAEGILPKTRKTRRVSYQFNDGANDIAPEIAPEIAQQAETTAAAETQAEAPSLEVNL